MCTLICHHGGGYQCLWYVFSFIEKVLNASVLQRDCRFFAAQQEFPRKFDVPSTHLSGYGANLRSLWKSAISMTPPSQLQCDPDIVTTKVSQSRKFTPVLTELHRRSMQMYTAYSSFNIHPLTP